MPRRYALFAVLGFVLTLCGAARAQQALTLHKTWTLPGAPFREGYIFVDGFHVRYVEAGKGPAIISLPGSAGLEMSIAKDELSKRFHVIELEPPGWGYSLELTRSMTQKELAGILADAIQQLGIPRYTLIGTSLGGTNALWIAVQHPDRVQALVFESAVTFMRPQDAAQTPDDMQQIQKALTEGWLDQTKALPGLPMPTNGGKPWETNEYYAELMRRRFRMFKHLATDPAETKDLSDRAHDLKIPGIAMVGTEDETMHTSVADSWKEHMPDVQFIIVPGGAQDLQNTTPDVFVATVTKFVHAQK
jgi:pimeloyl-ACP methyl ester carboxylesterase